AESCAYRACALLTPSVGRDRVGAVMDATKADVERALKQAQRSGQVWQATPVHERALCLKRAAQMLEEHMQSLLGLIVREAGKSLPNAIAEVREAEIGRASCRERGWIAVVA